MQSELYSVDCDVDIRQTKLTSLMYENFIELAVQVSALLNIHLVLYINVNSPLTKVSMICELRNFISLKYN